MKKTHCVDFIFDQVVIPKLALIIQHIIQQITVWQLDLLANY